MNQTERKTIKMKTCKGKSVVGGTYNNHGA